jgi:hypothetical protein
MDLTKLYCTGRLIVRFVPYVRQRIDVSAYVVAALFSGKELLFIGKKMTGQFIMSRMTEECP